MLSIYNILGYKIYFSSDRVGEPIHVHICKGIPKPNATKIWITSRGGVLLCNNKSRIPLKDLNKILSFIERNKQGITKLWMRCFGGISYYC